MVGVAAILSALVPGAAAQASTPHLAAVVAALHQRNPGTQGKVWWFSHGNSLPADWLLQTPDCWGSRTCPDDPPAGGKAILARMTQIISGAQRSVDFSGLFPPPSGGFRQAIIDGLVAAASHGYRPTVRILVGTPPFQFGSARKYLDGLVKDLNARGVHLPVQVTLVSTHRQVVPPLATSWDHSKVISVDGRSAIVGGMNYWAKDYLQTADPASDVSMTVDGPAASDATRWENLLWSWVCANRGRHLYVELATANLRGCVSHVPTLDVHPAGNVPVLTLGRLGNGIPVPGEPPGRESPPIPRSPLQGSACNIFQRQVSDTNTNREYEYRNPGETGLRALIGSARHSVFLSQQDLLSCVYHVEALFDERVFAELASKIAERIPITIVLSDDGAKVAGAGYQNKPIKQVAHSLARFVAAARNISYTKARRMVCRDVALGGIHSAHERTWPNGSPFANHAKVVSVDNQAFYIGSENLYPARLQELGLVVEDRAASATLKASYLDPLWRFSQPYALSDPQHGRCGSF